MLSWWGQPKGVGENENYYELEVKEPHKPKTENQTPPSELLLLLLLLLYLLYILHTLLIYYF